jgi:hypothetical protein
MLTALRQQLEDEASANDNRSHHSRVNRAMVAKRSGRLKRKRELTAR